MHTNSASDRIKSSGGNRSDWFARVRSGFGMLTELIFPKSDTEKLLDILGPEKVADMIPHAEIAEDDLVLAARDAHAVWPYRHPLAESIIHLLKSGGSRVAAECAGIAAWRYIEQRLFEKMRNHEIILIPIPLSPRRRRERGYNQSEWIAEAIARYAHVKRNRNDKKKEVKIDVRTDILERITHTTRQALKNKAERQQAISKHIFRAVIPPSSPSLSSSTPIYIIIDDVITTGSTLASAREALVVARVAAEDVLILALGH